MTRAKKLGLSFVLSLGMAFGFNVGAQSLIPCDTCEIWRQECEAGNQQSCKNFAAPKYHCAGCYTCGVLVCPW